MNEDLKALLKAWKSPILPRERFETTLYPQIMDTDPLLERLPRENQWSDWAVYLFWIVSGRIVAAGVRYRMPTHHAPTAYAPLDRAALAMVTYVGVILDAAMRGTVAPPAPRGIGIVSNGGALPEPYEFDEEWVPRAS